MKKRIICLVLACCLFLSAIPIDAYASNFYLIEDSATRRLTKEELYTWSYDALGYVLNEIFARHGYHFIPGGQYDNYFRCQSWYIENTRYDTNQLIYQYEMSEAEWFNESLVKDVRTEMRNEGNLNLSGKGLPAVTSLTTVQGIFSSFTPKAFAANQVLPVYTGPDENYYRATFVNGGHPVVSTNDTVWVAGWENGWLMVMYVTNSGHVRVGYVPSESFTDVINAPRLGFSGRDAIITSRCVMTDDPVVAYTSQATLEQGTNVTYLSTFINDASWAYIETMVNGKPCRGFVETSSIAILDMEIDK